MRTILEVIAALTVIAALSVCLALGSLWLLYMALIISLFYKGVMIFLIVTITTGFVILLSVKIFDKHIHYKLWQ